MNDVQMTKDSDLAIVHYDIVPTDSIEQAVLIHLRWFLGEWVYDEQYGVDYYGSILVKNPNRTLVLRIITDEIMKVDGVTGVSNITLAVNKKTRVGTISFTLATIQGRKDLMETLDFDNHDLSMKVYISNGRLIIEKTGPFVIADQNKLTFMQMAEAYVAGGRLQLKEEV